MGRVDYKECYCRGGEDMKEYRVYATFYDVYKPRVYKGKTTTSLEEAKELLKQAKHYYNEYPYKKRTQAVTLQSREITEWEKVNYDTSEKDITNGDDNNNYNEFTHTNT